MRTKITRREQGNPMQMACTHWLLMTAVTSPSESMHHSSFIYNFAFANDLTGCGKLKLWNQNCGIRILKSLTMVW